MATSEMNAAVVESLGAEPRFGTKPLPARAEGHALVAVSIAAVNPVDVSISTATSYAGPPEFPYVPGLEAVGRVVQSQRLPSGSRVYAFGDALGVTRDGAMAEYLTIPDDDLVPIPEAVEDDQAVALGIAGLAGWLPLAWSSPVKVDDRVLIMGATGVAGSIAVQAARALGAARVVAAGRNQQRLEELLALGADATVNLSFSENLVSRIRTACGGDGPTLVVDGLWGLPGLAAVEAAAPEARIVVFGAAAGTAIDLSVMTLREKRLEFYGHSNLAPEKDERNRQYLDLLERAITKAIRLEIREYGLREIDRAWRHQMEGTNGVKLVITCGNGF